MTLRPAAGAAPDPGAELLRGAAQEGVEELGVGQALRGLGAWEARARRSSLNTAHSTPY